jgi:Raf kinase inhibitor-like YbhB/YbcL family protein
MRAGWLGIVVAASLAFGCSRETESDDSAGPPAPGQDGGSGTVGSAGQAGGGGTAGDGGASTSGGSSASDGGVFALSSSAIAPGGTFPTDNTCGGLDQSPPLAWTAGPAGTQSYGIILYDISVNIYHWAVWDLPATTLSLPAAIPVGATLATPAGAQQQGLGQAGYRGPCPPFNAVHTYEFTVYALDALPLPGLSVSSTVQQVETAMLSHALANAKLDGTSNGL